MEGLAPYHHGDLRAALLRSALEIVEGDGVSALSLRAVARRSGVSAMAPYHHFRDRAALVAAVAAKGFERLHAATVEALQNSGADSLKSLVASACVYVDFVVANPALYRLMYSAELADRTSFPDLAEAAAAPSANLARLVATAAGAGYLGSVDRRSAALQIWAMAHGIGLLAIDGYLGADPRPRAIALVGDSVATMLSGWSLR